MNNVIVKLDFPYTELETIVDFLTLRKHAVEARREASTTVAVFRGCSSELGVIGALEFQFQQAHDRLLFDDCAPGGPRGFVMNETLHAWLVREMWTEVERHESERDSYTGFATSEVFLWKMLTERFDNALPYGEIEDDTQLVVDDETFDKLLAA